MDISVFNKENCVESFRQLLVILPDNEIVNLMARITELHKLYDLKQLAPDKINTGCCTTTGARLRQNTDGSYSDDIGNRFTLTN